MASQIDDKRLIEMLQEDPHKGWSIFLDTYARLIYSYAVKSFHDVDMASDFNLFVYEALAANNFKKLKSFKFRCKLSSYLVTLLGNLKSDFTRSKFGRRTLPERIKRLPEFAQSLFKMRFWENLSFEEAALRMKSAYGEKATDAAIDAAMDQVHDSLSIKMRGRIQKIRERRVLADYPANVQTVSTLPDGDLMPEFPDSSLNPENLLNRLEREENFQRLTTAFSRLVEALPFEERRLFVLRFDKGLSAKEIALKMKIRPSEKVYTLLNQIKDRLGEELRRQGFDVQILKDSFGE
ncbi:MAG: sigma factor-like helix-turn-helix DNA-binding protein [Acidobacteriia bacterium]|nr:sigma factor-like helix-turn-helix DNA-binding protein [Terriglobia bacterium]